MYDYLIVGAGLYGATAARRLTDAGKRVLDLGCGYGEHCISFVPKGADRVVGIDISEKMLEVAKSENSDPKIEYLLMPIEDIDKITEKFDIAISSLALHYVEDFEGVVRNVNNLLTPGGEFIFSQEHPQFKDSYHKPDFLLIKAVKR